ncbi:TerB family tellurite resistance protein [Ramlibacter rhizophilus]|uniref:TerB family tellurite resistance protein n=1 Tax=Ramlibacter rhizophilus TaxID=1781167 RepID=A0A4Z0BKG9_9BURK|nr:TerB family tellurite resistance protein [Ramlibacter rhizophilus]TFY98767.1 TerB family tellurite resistance protein [Ramlibacter rhizophilus]
MLRTLKDLFDSIAAPQKDPGDREHSLQLATAVLLVEVMRADEGFGESEREAVLHALRQTFPLAEDEGERLVELAHEHARSSSDFHQFTSVLNERLETEEKIRIVEYMWRVAYADGHLGAHENHIMARIASLLHVTHGEYIAAKMKAKGEPLSPL